MSNYDALLSAILLNLVVGGGIVAYILYKIHRGE